MGLAARASTDRRTLMSGHGCAAVVVVLWAAFGLASRFPARNGTGAGLVPAVPLLGEELGAQTLPSIISQNALAPCEKDDASSKI